jgi:hypothetical protein
MLQEIATQGRSQVTNVGYMIKLTTGGSTHVLDAITVQPSFLDFFCYIHIILTIFYRLFYLVTSLYYLFNSVRVQRLYE